MKNIAEAREKVFQMFGSDGLQAFDEVIRDEAGTITIGENRVTFHNIEGAILFRAGEADPDSEG
ncbi:hypothetical protein GC087_01350 [Pantoea sp. JZ2]|uniref:hypothetical protein n=1 Tax=Pantoea sp. JZ2 TaxID=2654189 RepID=UPI002B4656A5|nr:hypothetical protein [Pantoea sp. JZ2]WRH11356.1 hypothetical protein GC087_01350 [Pantoea sp. JZ2]